MDQELIQAAIDTFCIVPEVYQQAFQQMGAEFPDELVQAIKTKPEDAVEMVQNDKELLKGIVTIYQQYGDKINKAVQATQQTGMFAKGGKLNYLLEKSIVYAQDGTKIRRRDAMRMAMGAGLSRSQARAALANAKNAVGKYGVESVYNSFKDKQMNATQPAQSERRILSIPTPQVTVQTPTLTPSGNFEDFEDFEAQRTARKNAALEQAYNNIMAGKWGNGHDVRAQHAAEAGLNYNDVRAYVNAHTPIQIKTESNQPAQLYWDMATGKIQPWRSKREWDLLNSRNIANIPYK